MSNQEAEHCKGHNEYGDYEGRIVASENEQDQRLYRRKFLKISIGAGLGLAAGGVSGVGYSLKMIDQKLREVKKEYPKPSAYDYDNAVNKVNLYTNRANLYQQCREIADRPEICDVFHPENMAGTQHAQSVITDKNAYDREAKKRGIPWVIAGGSSAGLTLGGIGRAIVSGFQLRRVNREIRALGEGNPSETTQK